MALTMIAGLITSKIVHAAAWNKDAFAAKGIVAVLTALGGTPPAASKEIELVAPDNADNGAAVPITINSKLPGTQSIALLVEKNPNTLSALFEIPEGTDASITTRVKMAETSRVSALVKANGKYYVAEKEIRVTLGGCGD